MTVASDLRATASQGPSLLLTLTDEELVAVLDGAPAPTPYLDVLDEAAAQVAVSSGVRSLVARGLAEPLVEPGASLMRTAVEVRVLAELAVVLTLRTRATRVVTALTATAEDPDGTTTLFHVHPGQVVLAERVTPGGLHLFTLATGEDAAALLADEVDPGSAAGPVADPVTLPAAGVADPADVAWSTLRRALDDAVVVTELLATGADGLSRLISLYATADAVWVVSGEAGAEQVEASSVSPDGLGALLRGLLADA
ncbi:MAG: hypothetical protein JWM64_511 [Frankiales bacterium]|nr:hypothetical protein [Frankiales bacterium]